MASVTTIPATSTLLAPFRAAGKAVLDFFEAAALAQSRSKLIEELHGMSDAQLEEIGIERDEIVHYVFRDRMGF